MMEEAELRPIGIRGEPRGEDVSLEYELKCNAPLGARDVTKIRPPSNHITSESK